MSTYLNYKVPSNLQKIIKIKVVGAQFGVQKNKSYEAESNNCKWLF